MTCPAVGYHQCHQRRLAFKIHIEQHDVAAKFGISTVGGGLVIHKGRDASRRVNTEGVFVVVVVGGGIISFGFGKPKKKF